MCLDCNSCKHVNSSISFGWKLVLKRTYGWCVGFRFAQAHNNRDWTFHALLHGLSNGIIHSYRFLFTQLIASFFQPPKVTLYQSSDKILDNKLSDRVSFGLQWYLQKRLEKYLGQYALFLHHLCNIHLKAWTTTTAIGPQSTLIYSWIWLVTV